MYNDAMNLSLRRFEAFVIFGTFAALCALVLVALLWNGGVGGVLPQLLPAPNVTNQKEAILKSLENANAPATPEKDKLQALQALKVTSKTDASKISEADKLKLLGSLGTH